MPVSPEPTPDKAPGAYRTIGEVAGELDLPQHVLRFWETRFPAVRPLKRSGNRRHYRPEDVALLRGIRELLYDRGYTIRGVQKVLKEGGLGALRATGRGEGGADDAHLAFADAGWAPGEGAPGEDDGPATANWEPAGTGAIGPAAGGPWTALGDGLWPTRGTDDGAPVPKAADVPGGEDPAMPATPPPAPATPRSPPPVGSVSIVRGGLRPPAPPAPAPRPVVPTPGPAAEAAVVLALAELDAARRLLVAALAATAPPAA